MRDGTTTTVILNSATNLLRQAGCKTPRLDAEVLFMDAFSWNRTDLIIEAETVLDSAAMIAFWLNVDRRKTREPVAHILGYREFWSHEFKVNCKTLVPRPDSETLIEACLGHVGENKDRPLRILDLGTGSGCLILTLLMEFRNASGVGVDVSAEALSVANDNAILHGLEERIRFHKSNWFDAIRSEDKQARFDLIISNPPYVSSNEFEKLMPEVTNFEPMIALDGGPDGLQAYETIIAGSAQFLAPGGVLILELGIGQSLHVTNLLLAESLTDIELHKDLAGVERCAIATLQGSNAHQ